ncbi:hypothetical protein QUA00_19400 [Microcoleus sp. T2B6]|uniref:hypothetical protein n=1 Tax=Microcoleus sp. T2B6 TaxID=3055424 RepID=UPI002FCF1AC6
MQKFIQLWLGQAASMIGSAMSAFALTIWIWESTSQATALALLKVMNKVIHQLGK